METLDTPDILEKKARRPLLVVLSVLTFISAASRLFFAGTFFTEIRLSAEKLDRDSSLRWVVLFFFLIAISALVNTIGTILMLRRKRGAYIVYLSGQLLFLLGVVCLTLSLVKDFRHMPWQGYLIFTGLYVLPVVFAILYRVALRKPKNGGAI